MGAHDDLLEQGPHTAPEPETAEERTRRLGKRGLAGGAAVGVAAVAKLGALKFLLWAFAIRSAVDLLHVGIWVVPAVFLVLLGLKLALRARREG